MMRVKLSKNAVCGTVSEPIINAVCDAVCEPIEMLRVMLCVNIFEMLCVSTLEMLCVILCVNLL